MLIRTYQRRRLKSSFFLFDPTLKCEGWDEYLETLVGISKLTGSQSDHHIGVVMAGALVE